MNNLPQLILDGLQFEKSNWTSGAVTDDPFYTPPHDTLAATPGSLLKVEEETDTSKYMIPPGTGLSRFMYVSESLTGSAVPVSGLILWPYSPRSQADGYQIVAWAHGSSGAAPDSAPSHHKNLWQHFLAPYQLALQGYVVVATDYAGLGVSKNASGHPIIHQYLACPSHANDVIYSVQAAQVAFPCLSKDFVVIGHSQGGGTAWAASQRQAFKPVPGFLGAVAVSPLTDVFKELEPILSVLAASLCPGMASVFPDFNPSAILTPDGQQRLDMVLSLGCGIACSMALLSNCNLLRPEWKEDTHVQKYRELIMNGGKELGAPLLVIHGDADPLLSPAVVTAAVKKTIELHPSSNLNFVMLPQVTHTPALTAAQSLWMDWIADRFGGRTLDNGPRQSRLTLARPGKSYQAEQNWFLEPATQFYQAP